MKNEWLDSDTARRAAIAWNGPNISDKARDAMRSALPELVLRSEVERVVRQAFGSKDLTHTPQDDVGCGCGGFGLEAFLADRAQELDAALEGGAIMLKEAGRQVEAAWADRDRLAARVKELEAEAESLDEAINVNKPAQVYEPFLAVCDGELLAAMRAVNGLSGEWVRHEEYVAAMQNNGALRAQLTELARAVEEESLLKYEGSSKEDRSNYYKARNHMLSLARAWLAKEGGK